MWQENANFVLLVSWEQENWFLDGGLLGEGLWVWEGRGGEGEREISRKRKLKTEGCKVKTRQWWGCCFQEFVLAELVSCSTECIPHSMEGASLERQVEAERFSGLTSHSGVAGWPSWVNFTVEMGQVWGQAWARTRGELQKPQVLKRRGVVRGCARCWRVADLEALAMLLGYISI